MHSNCQCPGNRILLVLRLGRRRHGGECAYRRRPLFAHLTAVLMLCALSPFGLSRDENTRRLGQRSERGGAIQTAGLSCAQQWPGQGPESPCTNMARACSWIACRWLIVVEQNPVSIEQEGSRLTTESEPTLQQGPTKGRRGVYSLCRVGALGGEEGRLGAQVARQL